jgi:hypothetical protein
MEVSLLSITMMFSFTMMYEQNKTFRFDIETHRKLGLKKNCFYAR